jgi:hypothetical protein
MRTALKTMTAAAALMIAWRVGEISRTAAQLDAQPRLSARTPPRIPPHGQFRGLAIQLDGGVGVYDKYNRLIPEVADLGANTVLFVVHGWQEHAGTQDLHIDGQRTAKASDLGKLCDLAKAQGLRTILMPIVLLSHPRNNEWRGRIVPADRDWDGWFKRYTQFIVHFARLAERHHVDLLMVGSELIKTEVYTEHWRRVIQEVRQQYRGKLGYSANWDHYQTDKIGFWPELDFVGMTTYYELAAGSNPTIEEIDANWADIKTEIKGFQQEVKRPIIFTEVGWCSQEGAAHEGWNYYANQKATEAGQKEQALLYESFMKVWSNEPGVGGIIWWEWDTTPGGKDDFNYTPRGKLAEGLLRRWLAGELDSQVVNGPPGSAARAPSSQEAQPSPPLPSSQQSQETSEH